MDIYRSDLRPIEQQRYEIVVTTYKDSRGDLHYAASMPGGGMTVGISSDSPYDAIAELCERLADEEGRCTDVE